MAELLKQSSPGQSSIRPSRAPEGTMSSQWRRRVDASITLRFLLPTITLLVVAVGAAGAWLSHEMATLATEQAARELESATSRVEQALSDSDGLVGDTVRVSMRVLLHEAEALGAPAAGPTVPVGSQSVPDLLLGRKGQANTTTLVDRVKALTDSTATLFSRRGDDFIRVSTNVLAADGTRAVGTALDPAGRAIVALRQGQSFYGMVEILGQPYMTAYEPIRNATGQVIGAWYSGRPVAALTRLQEMVASTRILDHGFLAVFDAKGRIRLKSSHVDEAAALAVASADHAVEGWRTATRAFGSWRFRIVAAYPVSDVNARVARLQLGIGLAGVLVAAVLAAVLSVFFRRLITQPLAAVEASLRGLARGRLGTRLHMNRTDEIGTMAGELDRFAEDLQLNVIGTMRRIAAGDLSADVVAKDVQDEISPALSRTVESLRALVDEASALTTAAVEGRLATRGRAERFHGAYRQVIEGVNATLDAVIGPLNVAAEYVDRIAKGDIPPRITDEYKGDFNELKNNLNVCIEAVDAMRQDVRTLAVAALNGRLGVRADWTRHQGVFAKIVKGFNDTLDAVIGPLNVAAEYVDRISKGDIPPKITDEYKGDFNELKTNVNGCIGAVEAMRQDVRTLAIAALEGRLGVRADWTRHQGVFGKIVKGFDDTLDAVIGPLNVAAEYVDQIAKGQIPPKVTDDYKGDFNAIKNNLNQCIDGLGGLLEANAVLQRMAVNDYTAAVDGEYQGVFADVACAVNETRQRVLRVQATAEKIAAGDLSDLEAYRQLGNGTGRRSENDRLAPAMIRMMSAVQQLVADAEQLSQAAVDGRLATRADATRHSGDFRRVVLGVNATLDAVIGPLNVAAEYMDRIAKGDVPDKITREYRGDFNEIKRNLNTCIDAVKGLVEDVASLVEAAVAGRLVTRADVSRHQGDFRRIVEGVNRTLDATTEPVAEAARVLATIARQDLRAEVEGAYAGDHAAIKDSINTMVRDLRSSIEQIGREAGGVGASSEELSAISRQMADNAGQTAQQTAVVSAASEQVSQSLGVVATGAEEMLASIREIAKASNEAARMARDAVSTARATDETVRKLGDSSTEIGNVINVITSIAEQTNLLALNATIEAARAGDAGKGFAVVANEVKELAKQTAQATEDIGRRIDAIQGETKGAVAAIQQIAGVIGRIDEASGAIASAVEEQTATTNEIGRNIADAARGSAEIARNVATVADAARTASQGAADTEKAAGELARMAGTLQSLVGKFAV
jgi:methyl-accepting chemotaxis protein